MKASKILVLGSSNVDLIFRIPRFHGPGETIAGENLIKAFGGKGANQAVAAKRLAGKVRFITKLGNDSFGRSYRQYFIRNGLESPYLLRDTTLPTGVALIEVGPQGENRIIVSPGANGSLVLKDLKNLTGAWKGIGVFLAQIEIPLATIMAGLKAAKRQGIITLLNPSPVIPLPPSIFSLVDYLVPNEWEAEQLTGKRMRRKGDIPATAQNLLARGVKNIVITRGDKGLFFKNHDEEVWMDAFRVNPVDTTAAGDAFLGALACGLAEGKPIREALAMANAAGALAATKLGAQPSLPYRKDLDRFLSQRRKRG